MINVDADIVILDESFPRRSGIRYEIQGAFLEYEKPRQDDSNSRSFYGNHEGHVRQSRMDETGKIRELGPPNVVCGHYETELSNPLKS